mmetsp:Transcript_9182/g.20308  ORF Transcript_9182/g.20308 Transcript_9182/m.20308 type:complete len:706 (+) Transcript_9182:80-2197(+)
MQAERSLHVCLLGDPLSEYADVLRCYADSESASLPQGMPMESYVTEVELGPNGEFYRARFTDNSGAEQFSRMQATILGSAHALVLCFALEMPETLSNIQSKWLPLVWASGSEAPILILGLRKELFDGAEPGDVADRARTLARSNGALDYLECSVLHPETVHQAMGEALAAAQAFFAVQWQLEPSLAVEGELAPSTDDHVLHERLNVSEDFAPLGADAMAANVSMLGPTPSGHHAYLRADLGGASLTSVDLLRSFEQLQFLDLSRNRLKSLEPLGSLRSLLQLNASYNLLIHTQCFAPPEALEVVDMSYNLIGELGQWASHRYLRELSLRGNFITAITQGLSSNKELRVLDLSENFISCIENMEGLGLRTFHLAQNRIKSLQGIGALGKLHLLNVRHNNITSIAALRAEEIPRLRKLRISDNRLSQMREVHLLADFPFLCDLYVAPNPVNDLPFYREQVLHRLPHLRSLDSTPVAAEEKVKADVVYGADVEKRREIFEKELPGESFVDRRLVAEEGLAHMELEQFGQQGDAGPYGFAAAATENSTSSRRTHLQELKFLQRLAQVRSGGLPQGVADFSERQAPCSRLAINDGDLPVILEACREGNVERILLCGAGLSPEGMLALLAFLSAAHDALRFVDLSSCSALGLVATEFVSGFPHERGIRVDAAECGLTDGDIQRLRGVVASEESEQPPEPHEPAEPEAQVVE